MILGSTGEAVHLTNKERFEVLSACRKAFEDSGFKNYPIIAGTAAQNIEEVVEQLKTAKEAGVQWGLCLVPGYFAAAITQEGIVKWFTAVADQSPIPIMVYISPSPPFLTRRADLMKDIIIPASRITLKSFHQHLLPFRNIRISWDASSRMVTSRIMLRSAQIRRSIIHISIRLLA